MLRRLGLDIGTNSIGWCLTEGPGNEADRIVDIGVRIFSDGRDPQSGTSLVVDRRDARSARRRRDRYIGRRSAFLEALVAHGLMPADTDEAKLVAALDPYVLRTKALDEALTPHEIGRTLFHLNQRRGFKSNRKAERKTKDAEEAQAYDFYPQRRHIEYEFARIWEEQAKHHPALLTEWHRNDGVIDLNPAGRIQTRKNRPALPVTGLLVDWLTATDDRLVCHESIVEEGDNRWLVQRPVADVKKAWSVMARQFGIPLGYGRKLMRHSMATLVAQRGVSPTEIPLALGHAMLPPSTRRYVIFSPHSLADTRRALEDITAELARKVAVPLRARRTQLSIDGRTDCA